MMSKEFALAVAALMSASAMLTAAPLASAEARVLELWHCELATGKTLADVKRVNGKWLKLQNEANPGADIQSWGLSSIVGKTADFKYIDSFPSLDVWSKSRAVSKTPAGVAMDAELSEVADCTSNELFDAESH